MVQASGGGNMRRILWTTTLSFAFVLVSSSLVAQASATSSVDLVGTVERLKLEILKLQNEVEFLKSHEIPTPHTLDPNKTTWTVPDGIYQVRIELFGPGGNGGELVPFQTVNAAGSGGGGGGGFVMKVLRVVPRMTYLYHIGVPALGKPGGNTWFGVKSGDELYAEAGGDGGNTVYAYTSPGWGGAGGSGGGSMTPDVVVRGGDGYRGTYKAFGFGAGGKGGSSVYGFGGDMDHNGFGFGGGGGGDTAELPKGGYSSGTGAPGAIIVYYVDPRS